MYDGATSVPGIPHGAIDPSSRFPHAVEEGDVEELEAEDGDADEEVVEEDAADKVASGDAEKMMLSVKKKSFMFHISRIPQPHTYQNRVPTTTAYQYLHCTCIGVQQLKFEIMSLHTRDDIEVDAVDHLDLGVLETYASYNKKTTERK